MLLLHVLEGAAKIRQRLLVNRAAIVLLGENLWTFCTIVGAARWARRTALAKIALVGGAKMASPTNTRFIYFIRY